MKRVSLFISLLQKVEFPLIIILLSLNALYTLFLYREIFFSITNFDNVSDQFKQSQYILGEKAELEVSDEIVYMYAGYAYAEGQDPTTVNFEHPPLGKYFIGFSYRLVHNMYWPSFIAYVGVSVLFYLLLQQTLTSSLFRIGGVGAFLLLSLFRSYSALALLDHFQLFFTLLFFILLFIKVEKKKSNKLFFTIQFVKAIVLGLVFGSLASIKYPFPVMGLFIVILALWNFSRREFLPFCITICTGFITYLSTYIVYFLYGHSFIDFVKFEWFRFNWWVGDRGSIPKFLVLFTLFVGKFKGWWKQDVYEVATDWSLLWPVFFLFSIVALPFTLLSKKVLFLALYSFGMIALYAFGSAANQRYLMQVLPFWILIALYGLEKVVDLGLVKFKSANYNKHT